MRRRWIGPALAVALVGLTAGYAVGALTRTDPAPLASARPVPAVSPSVPVEPAAGYAPDIDFPTLKPGLAYSERRIGIPPYDWAYDVPLGWTPEQVGLLEVRWRPEGEPRMGGHSLRVKIINQRNTEAQMVAQKRAALTLAYDDIDFTAQTGNMLSFSYRELATNRQRFNTFRWFTPPGGTTADFEMSVSGRRVDQAGLRDLYEQVSASVRKL